MGLKFCYHADYIGYKARNYSCHLILTPKPPCPRGSSNYIIMNWRVWGESGIKHITRIGEKTFIFHTENHCYCRILSHVVTAGVSSSTPSHWCNFCLEFCTFQTREQQTLKKSTQFAKKQKQNNILKR